MSCQRLIAHGGGQSSAVAPLPCSPTQCVCVCGCVGVLENLPRSREGQLGLSPSAHAGQPRGRILGSKWLTCPRQGSGGTLW